MTYIINTEELPSRELILAWNGNLKDLARWIMPKPWKHDMETYKTAPNFCKKCGVAHCYSNCSCTSPPSITDDLKIIAWDLKYLACEIDKGFFFILSLSKVLVADNYALQTHIHWIRAALLSALFWDRHKEME